MISLVKNVDVAFLKRGNESLLRFFRVDVSFRGIQHGLLRSFERYAIFQGWPFARHVFQGALGARYSYSLAGLSSFDRDRRRPQMKCHLISPPPGERAPCWKVPGWAA